MTEKLSHTILVIEDEETIRKPLVEALIREGFHTLSAHDGAQGLAIALEEKPDVILLDINLPIMDGMEVMKKVRQSGDFGKAVKIILITSLTPDDDMTEGIAKDEPSYFLKKAEWSIPGVLQKIREVLDMAEPEEASG